MGDGQKIKQPHAIVKDGRIIVRIMGLIHLFKAPQGGGKHADPGAVSAVKRVVFLGDLPEKLIKTAQFHGLSQHEYISASDKKGPAAADLTAKSLRIAKPALQRKKTDGKAKGFQGLLVPLDHSGAGGMVPGAGDQQDLLPVGAEPLGKGSGILPKAVRREVELHTGFLRLIDPFEFSIWLIPLQ